MQSFWRGSASFLFLFLCTNLCFILFLSVVQNHGGNIVNISATLPYKGQALQVHAGSAKAANGKNDIDFIYTQTSENCADHFMAYMFSDCPKMQWLGIWLWSGAPVGWESMRWRQGQSRAQRVTADLVRFARLANWIIILINVWMSVKC